MSSYPEDLLYTKDHEWVRLSGDRGTVGITDHAQNQLGDVVFVELPDVGTTVETGQRFGTVESVKAVSELYSPVTGEVVEVNKKLTQPETGLPTPELVNTEPYGEAWMIVVKLKNPAAVSSLMDAKQYKAHVESEAKH
jgi:glycine cleavage system H protein